MARRDGIRKNKTSFLPAQCRCSVRRRRYFFVSHDRVRIDTARDDPTQVATQHTILVACLWRPHTRFQTMRVIDIFRNDLL
jgi:hypothetical protein